MIKYSESGKVTVDVGVTDLSKAIQYLMIKLDGTEEDTTVIEDGLYDCLRAARRDPGLFRDYRHDLLSRRRPDLVPDDHPLRKIYDKYGCRSVFTNTAGRMVSIIKLTDLEVKRQTKDYIPPAFNTSLPYKGDVPDEHNAYKLLDDYQNIPGLKEIVNKLRDVRREYLNKYSKPNSKRIILLDNNSSQGYTSGTVSITDLMGNIYYYKPLEDPLTHQNLTFSHLARLVGLKNSRDDDDPFVYLEKEDQYNGYKFNIVAIADKDGKIRVIFQGSNDVQTVSKGLHELFDKVARSLPGNYTYNQRDWIDFIIKNKWHRYKYIVGTDMSKYSDTLHRRFILEILRKAEFSEDEIREIDLLYSCPVKNLDGKILGDDIRTLATYQGQYGDFPLITIANLALQYMVMYILGERVYEGTNAAVGDDTGFAFSKYHKNAMDVIINVYGSVGVKINKLKTGELHYVEHPDGVVDFVKLRFDIDGLLPFMEPKPYFKHDFDQAVRDIYDSIFLSTDTKAEIFKVIFDDKASYTLMDKSIINGGINKRVIEPRDVNELLSNRIMLSDLNNIKFGNFYTWLNQAYKELLEGGSSWRETVFSELKDCKDRLLELEQSLDNGNITYDEYESMSNGYIMLQIAKTAEIGSVYNPSDYHELIGNDPEIIWNNHKDKKMKRLYSKELERLYEMIKDNDSLLGRLRKRKIKKSSTVYKDKLETDLGTGNVEDWLSISKKMKKCLVAFDTLEDYATNVREAAAATNAYKILSYLKGTGMIFSRTNMYGEHWYVRFNGIQYRLFNDHNTSRYPLITDQIKNQIPILKDWDLKDLFEYYSLF